jgi:hypothetical protein
MTQAVNARTTTRACFASTVTRRNRPAPTELETALATIKAYIRSLEQPFEPRHEADASDVADRADHLDEILGAAFAYTRAVHALDEAGALAWLRAQPSGRVTATAAELGRRWGWHNQRVGRRLTAWWPATL